MTPALSSQPGLASTDAGLTQMRTRTYNQFGCCQSLRPGHTGQRCCAAPYKSAVITLTRASALYRLPASSTLLTFSGTCDCRCVRPAHEGKGLYAAACGHSSDENLNWVQSSAAGLLQLFDIPGRHTSAKTLKPLLKPLCTVLLAESSQCTTVPFVMGRASMISLSDRWVMLPSIGANFRCAQH